MATQVTLNSGSVDSAGSLALKTNGTTTAVTINASQGVEFNAGAVGTPSITTTGDTNTGIFFPAADTIAFSEGGAEAMRIDSSGNVGIGTLSPVAKFQVAGTQTITSGSAASSANGLHLWFNTGTNTAYIQGYQTGVDWRNIVYNGSSHIWQITDVEKARITSDGNLLVARTNASFYGGTVKLGVEQTSGSAWGFGVNANGNAVVFNHTSNTSSAVGSISVTTSATTYGTSSDYRLKNTIAPMTGALDKVALLKPVTYKWNTDGSDGQGFIAHELQAVVPDAVTGEKDGEQMQGVDYGKLTPILTAALQEAIAKIETLEARIAVLETK